MVTRTGVAHGEEPAALAAPNRNPRISDGAFSTWPRPGIPDKRSGTTSRRLRPITTATTGKSQGRIPSPNGSLSPATATAIPSAMRTAAEPDAYDSACKAGELCLDSAVTLAAAAGKVAMLQGLNDDASPPRNSSGARRKPWLDVRPEETISLACDASA
mmetsp:Transcript_72700/g.115373  ORF Transcript_72700/g.115373 Transcript_72700/m.115373 type:complete len:159 (-) Transcript_72700:124-600(-)